MKSIVKSIVAVTLLGSLLSFSCLAAISFAQDYPWNSLLAQSSFSLVKLSSDRFHNSDSEHRTEVEPDTFAWGSTIVSTFQVARVYAHGGADIGFATSTDGGKTWTSGYLPNLTVNYKGGSLASASDPAVVYDAKRGQWLISALAIPPNPDYGMAVSISRSTDGIRWSKPVIADDLHDRDDKPWITCDDTASSPHYSNCYTEWDDPNANDLIYMSTSTDDGLTWGPFKNTADQSHRPRSPAAGSAQRHGCSANRGFKRQWRYRRLQLVRWRVGAAP